MTAPYAGAVDDGEGTALDSQTGKDYSFLAPWFVRGYTASLGADGAFVYTPLIPAVPGGLQYAPFPPDQVYSMIRQYYFSGDADPLGGFLTFLPSDDITVTEDGVTWRIPRRLSGSETWPSVDSGVSPWAFSMEGSGQIYIWRGYLAAKLLCTDNPDVATDSGRPLTYHVTENFLGGRSFDITVPSSDACLDLSSLIIPGTIRANRYDPVNPLNALVESDLDQQMIESFPARPGQRPLPVYTISSLTTDYIRIGISASDIIGGTTVNPQSDTVNLAFMQGGAKPGNTDWQAAAWASGGPPYVAEFLIGSANGALVLATGQWQIWAQLNDFPQVLVDVVGILWVV